MLHTNFLVNNDSVTIEARVSARAPKSLALGVTSSSASSQVLFHYGLGDEWTQQTLDNADTLYRLTLTGPWAGSAAFGWAEMLTRQLPSHIAAFEGLDKDALPPGELVLSWSVNGESMALEALGDKLGGDIKEYALGSVTFESPVMRVTDPCYEKGTWCAGTLPVVTGQWEASAMIGPTSWGRRVRELRIRHSSLPASVFEGLDTVFTDSGIDAGVDSGQCGFFDDARYPVDPAQLEWDEGTFYGECCETTLDYKKPGGGVVAGGAGVVTRSGFGDGGYPVLVLRNSAGDVTAAVLRYIGPEDDESDEDEDDTDGVDDEGQID